VRGTSEVNEGTFESKMGKLTSRKSGSINRRRVLNPYAGASSKDKQHTETQLRRQKGKFYLPRKLTK